MARPLDGCTIALAEGRQLEELSALLEAEGATTLRYPLLSILDAPDQARVDRWIDALIAGSFDLVILMTGEAVRRLLGFAERSGKREALIAALGRVPTLSRGPKPGQALREIGLKPTRVASAPTTDGVLQTLRDENLAGKRIGMTLYGGPNEALESFLRTAGATPEPVLSYVFAPASDDDRVAELIQRLDAGTIAVVVFTSSPQVERLVEVAGKRGLAEALARGMARTRVAAVGPLIADRLREAGWRVDICPEQGWVMKNLVRQIARLVGGS